MARTSAHDFRNWTSFPSSMKAINDEPGDFAYIPILWDFPVGGGSMIAVRAKVRGENIKLAPGNSHIAIGTFDEQSRYLREINSWLPPGTYDWREFECSKVVRPDAKIVRIELWGGWGLDPARPAVTWIDDAQIYQDGTLIAENKFSNWSPVIGAGVGAPIGGVAGYLLKEPLGPMVSEVVGAVLGGALGGGVGLLTALGIIPVPQIPALGAAPEGPVAPAQLGKYQITG